MPDYLHPPRLDRKKIHFRPVAERWSKFHIDDIAIHAESPVPDPGPAREEIRYAARQIFEARRRGAPVIICHGAHLIKNGLGPLLIRLVEEDWLTHIATNGAGVIHDWEFAHLGRSTEDVRANVAIGEFGIWEETGAWLGLAVHLGNLDGLGFGHSVGRMIHEDGLTIPSREELIQRIRAVVDGRSAPDDQSAAAFDLLYAIDANGLKAGRRQIPHPWKRCSILCACYNRGVPFTIHPGIGQDITYSHPLFAGGAIGRGAITDFLIYAAAIQKLQGGVYLSVGSSVVSPMIFEKSLSMARNILKSSGRNVDDFLIVVNDLARVDWDWTRGEPPVDNPAYYVRFMKSFSRMGGELKYIGLDNRNFLQNLYHELQKLKG